MNADEIAMVCETGVCLALIGAGTYLGRLLITRVAAPKQAAAGRRSTRTTAAVTETVPKATLTPVDGEKTEEAAA